MLKYKSAIFTKDLDDQKTVLTCKSKVLDIISLGYNKITIESPLLDADGNIELKKGKPIADPSKRDTENVPLNEDIDVYFKRQVLSYNPNAWIDRNKTKVGYEIPMTRFFYEFPSLESSDNIIDELRSLREGLMSSLVEVLGQ